MKRMRLIIGALTLAAASIALAYTAHNLEGKDTADLPPAVESVPSVESDSHRPSPTKGEIEETFGNLAPWIVAESVDKTFSCPNKSSHNRNVMRLATGGGRVDVDSVYAKVVDALVRNQWRKCTPDAGDAPDGAGWSNTGPWFSETYEKDGVPLRIERNYSMGTGDSISLFVEVR